MLKIDLNSSAGKMGKKVTQVLINNTGQKKTYHGVLTDTIEEGSRCKFMTDKGYMVMVRDSATWIVEVYEENE